MNIYEKLMTVRCDLLNKNLSKSGYNKFSHFAYYELKDFLSVATKMFKEQKLYSRFSLHPATSTEQETVYFTIINIEEPKEKEVYILPSAECFIGVKKDGTGGADPIQNLGGRITYLRRYMYFIALDLIEDDSVDNKEQVTRVQNVPKDNVSQANYTPPKTEDDMFKTGIKKGIDNIIKSLEKPDNAQYKFATLQAVCKSYNVDSIKDIKITTKGEYDTLVSKIKSELDLAKAGI